MARLELIDITKRYGEVKAADDISLDVVLSVTPVFVHRVARELIIVRLREIGRAPMDEMHDGRRVLMRGLVQDMNPPLHCVFNRAINLWRGISDEQARPPRIGRF